MARDPSGNRSGLVLVANRLPVQWDEDAAQWRTSPGGLVSALAPILENRGGCWVGWTGAVDAPSDPFVADAIRQVPVELSEEEVEGHYLGFCNGTIWPLYHDAIRPPEFHRHWWRPYQAVNGRFAARAVEAAGRHSAFWIHDYQLQLVPAELRRLGVEGPIGFFLHIPFPPPEVFGRLPWRRQVIEGLLGADVVGFQTRTAVRNFARAARAFAGATGPADGLTFNQRRVRVEAVPISIDVGHYRELAHRGEVSARADRLREELGSPDFLFLGVDRLDYTKGIDLRLRAFETLLERRPDLLGRVVFVQVAVPSREGVDEYRVMRSTIEELVGRVNGSYGRPGWTPVQYQYRSLDQEDLVAYYRAADVMVVTPLRDGMNLVAKEYLASRTEGTGVLVLSEFAGAAEQLGKALVVNPYDLDGLAATLGRAVDMPPAEQRRRITDLQRVVHRWDVFDWARRCLSFLDR